MADETSNSLDRWRIRDVLVLADHLRYKHQSALSPDPDCDRCQDIIELGNRYAGIVQREMDERLLKMMRKVKL